MSNPAETIAEKAAPSTPTEQAALDEAVQVLKENAQRFARMPAADKAALLRQCMPRLADVAEAWVSAGTDKRRTPAESGEEWFQGPVSILRNLRLMAEALEDIAAHGRVSMGAGQFSTRADGRVQVQVFPTSGQDGALFSGFSVHEVMQPGLSMEDVRARQASFYSQQDPEGGVSLVLGAGNAGAIGPGDVLHKLVTEGKVVILKMNPVNEEGGRFLEQAFQPLIDAGFVRIVYGGGDVGSYLVNHAGVDDVHMTGSNHTHDLIVWGPPGAERERRQAEGDPVLDKPITSELGNVSPVAIVPARYSDKELAFMARNVAAMVAQNCSFNCNAARVVVVSKQWPQREAFRERLAGVFREIPSRYAYYPGARERYEGLIARYPAEQYGDASAGHLPWALVVDADPNEADNPLFTDESFCPILVETALDAEDPAGFLAAYTEFANQRLWGTLNATIMIAPRLERSREVGAALDQAVDALRYGSVGINHWPALVYAMVAPAWGGHPSSTLADIQSGMGWVHNTYLLEGIEKTVLRGPLTMWPKPVWFADHRTGARMGRKFIRFEQNPGWLGVPGLAWTAMRG